jgi:hypothetical protein
MTGAISQDRESCQFHSCLMKNPLLYRPQSGREARERFLSGAALPGDFRIAIPVSLDARFVTDPR